MVAGTGAVEANEDGAGGAVVVAGTGAVEADEDDVADDDVLGYGIPVHVSKKETASVHTLSA